jgi:hypothetical protein
LARTHLRNAVGRLRMAVRLHPGRNLSIPESRLAVPETALTRAARKVAEDTLTPTLLQHSYRTYRFGRALGELDGLQVDAELLFAAAILHDTGLVKLPNGADFTLSSMRLAREVADQVGLSTAATEVLQTAITMHYTPGVTTTAGATPRPRTRSRGRSSAGPTGGPRPRVGSAASATPDQLLADRPGTS